MKETTHQKLTKISLEIRIVILDIINWFGFILVIAIAVPIFVMLRYCKDRYNNLKQIINNLKTKS